jgi:hypothetical protein
MTKTIIALLIIGLFIITTACSSVKTGDTGSSNLGNSNTVNNDVGNSNTANSDVGASDAGNGNVVTIASIKATDNLNKTFTVEGTVVNNLKIGRLSGFRLKDATDSIPISSQNLATINTTVKVTGVLKTSSYFGYYLAAIQQ